MKKVIAVLFMAFAMISGGIVADAKTPVKKRSTKTTQSAKTKTSSFSVSGKTYEVYTESEIGYQTLKFNFNENGKGNINYYMNVMGQGGSKNIADFTWKQNGNKVYIYYSDATDVFTLVNNGKALKNSKGDLARLVN